jgi:hypothetical protein
MNIEHLEASMIGADQPTLDDISRRLWQAYAAGDVSDVDAEAVSEAVEARRTALKQPRPGRRPARVSRPRRPPVTSRDSRERRRRVASSGAMPPAIAAQFTEGERSALSIVAGEIRTKGQCDLPIDGIAARAGVGRTTVQNALRVARGHGLLNIDERPRPGRKNLTNVITIVDASWQAWLRLGPRHRVQTSEHHEYKSSKKYYLTPAALPKGSGRPIVDVGRKCNQKYLRQCRR